jgi:hypothetical protein
MPHFQDGKKFKVKMQPKLISKVRSLYICVRF